MAAAEFAAFAEAAGLPARLQWAERNWTTGGWSPNTNYLEWSFLPDSGRVVELVSPPLREPSFAVAIAQRFARANWTTGRATALHVTVNASCLAPDWPDGSADRLIRLLALYDAFHVPLAKLFAEREAAESYARRFSAAFPDLFAALTSRQDALSLRDAAALFREHAPLSAPMPLGNRSGFRTTAVNVCKFLAVPCCIRSPDQLRSHSAAHAIFIFSRFSG